MWPKIRYCNRQLKSDLLLNIVRFLSGQEQTNKNVIILMKRRRRLETWFSGNEKKREMIVYFSGPLPKSAKLSAWFSTTKIEKQPWHGVFQNYSITILSKNTNFMNLPVRSYSKHRKSDTLQPAR